MRIQHRTTVLLVILLALAVVFVVDWIEEQKHQIRVFCEFTTFPASTETVQQFVIRVSETAIKLTEPGHYDNAAIMYATDAAGQPYKATIRVRGKLQR